MNKPIIAVDADDTIFDENNAIRLFINNKYGFNHTEEDYLVDGPFDNYWERIWKVNPEKMDAMYEEFVTSPEKASASSILHINVRQNMITLSGQTGKVRIQQP